jgi:hypothetical protein
VRNIVGEHRDQPGKLLCFCRKCSFLSIIQNDPRPGAGKSCRAGAQRPLGRMNQICCAFSGSNFIQFLIFCFRQLSVEVYVMKYKYYLFYGDIYTQTHRHETIYIPNAYIFIIYNFH